MIEFGSSTIIAEGVVPTSSVKPLNMNWCLGFVSGFLVLMVLGMDVSVLEAPTAVIRIRYGVSGVRPVKVAEFPSTRGVADSPFRVNV